MEVEYDEMGRLYAHIELLELLLCRVGDVLTLPEALPGAVEWALRQAGLKKCSKCNYYECVCR